MIELYINGVDAQTMGIRMGQTFRMNLDGIFTYKPFVQNESRLSDGIKIIPREVKVASRDVTLPFVIEGRTPEEFRLRKKAFEELLANPIEIGVPSLDCKYNLIYNGGASGYELNLQGTRCKVSVKFTEPNPKDRGKYL